MPDYRVFRLNNAGVIAAAQAFVGEDDAEALALARDIWPGANRELWSLDRHIARIEPTAPDAASR